MDPSSPPRGLHRFALFTAAWTLLLIIAGGLVTSTGSALAVPDWPLSYGTLMPPMVGGILYAHGHRMVAAFVGLLTVWLAVWTWRAEARTSLRWLGGLALLAVVIQSVLGGLTVIYLLPTAVSVVHATLAQVFFCIIVTLVLVTSLDWRSPGCCDDAGKRIRLRTLAAGTTTTIFVQLILGALIRHTESALVIPDFPLSFGELLPPLSALTVNADAPYPIPLDVLKTQVMIQFAHRVWAIIVTGALFWTFTRIVNHHNSQPQFVRPILLATGLALVQFLLGASIIWTERAVWIATLHVTVGAILLATSLVLTLRVWRASASTGRMPLMTERAVPGGTPA